MFAINIILRIHHIRIIVILYNIKYYSIYTISLSSPNDLKVLTSEKDFKADLNATQNLMLAMGLSRRTVLHCTQEFMESDYANYESAVQHVMPEVITPNC